MSDGRRRKQRLLLGIASEAGIQLVVFPVAAALLVLLANFIWAHR